MSTLIVEVVEIQDVKPHPNADALEIATAKGWQVVIRKGEFHAGDRAVYFPVDTVLPRTLSDRFGITRYLTPIRQGYAVPAGVTRDEMGGRIRAARLRGEVSFGLLLPADDQEWLIGRDLKEHYAVWKWEPPEELSSGDDAPSHPFFQKYTAIEHLRNFPTALQQLEIVCTEKVHGTNQRSGLICADGVWTWMAGGHSTRKREPLAGEKSIYWIPLESPDVRALLEYVKDNKHAVRSVILFSEVYGRKIQDLTYGANKVAFVGFDLAVDGEYLHYDELVNLSRTHSVPMVPLVWRGNFDLNTVLSVTQGKSLLWSEQIREGVVCRPVVEQYSPALNGRLVLKSISDEYYLRKSGTELH